MVILEISTNLFEIPGPLLAVNCVWLSHAVSPALFQNLFKFCTLYFCPNFKIFWKIACISLLSRIGPECNGKGGGIERRRAVYKKCDIPSLRAVEECS